MPDTVKLQMMVDAELDRALERQAVAHGMAKDALVADVLRDFVAAGTEADEVARTEEGLGDLREGRWLTHEHVRELFEQRFGPVR